MIRHRLAVLAYWTWVSIAIIPVVLLSIVECSTRTAYQFLVEVADTLHTLAAKDAR